MNTFKKNTPLVVTWKILGLSEMPVSLVGKTIKFKYKTSRGENDGTSDCTLKDDSVEWTLPVSKQKFCGVYSLELSVYHADGATLGRFTYDNAFRLSDAPTPNKVDDAASSSTVQSLALYSYSSASLYELDAAEADRQAVFNTNEANRQSTFETNEESRQSTFETSEASRKSTFNTNESVRQANEDVRKSNETTRQSNESTRQTNETARQSQEAARQTTFSNNEANRQSTFETKEAARQSTFDNNEATRQANETVRQTNETARKEAEASRQGIIDEHTSQIAELSQEVGKIKSEAYNFKESDEYVEIADIESIDNYYVNSIDGAMVYSWGWQTKKIKVSGYVHLKINSQTATSTTIMGYAFMSENNTYISGNQMPISAKKGEIVDETISVPNGAYYLIQTWVTSSTSFYCKGTQLIVNGTKIKDNAEAIEVLASSLAELNVECGVGVSQVSLANSIEETGYYLSYLNGEMIQLYGYNTIRISVKGCSKVMISAITSASGTARGYGFFDKDGNYLYGGSCPITGTAGDVITQTLYVPFNADYILQSFNMTDTFSAIGYGYNETKKITKLLAKMNEYNIVENVELGNVLEYDKLNYSPTSYPKTHTYSADNVIIDNGVLVLRTSKYSDTQYNVGGVSIDKISTDSGFVISTSLKFAKMKGLNQAAWAIGTVDNAVAKAFIENYTTEKYNASYSYKYEIDIVEFNYPSKAKLTIHLWQSTEGGDVAIYNKSLTYLCDDDEIHTFTFFADSDYIYYLIDGGVKMVDDNRFVFNSPTYILLSNTVGDTFGDVDTSMEQCDTIVYGLSLRTRENTKISAGDSASRPSLISKCVGKVYFDTTIAKPIWWNGSTWVDAMGIEV